MKEEIKLKESTSSYKSYGNGLNIFYKTLFIVVVVMGIILFLLFLLINKK